MNIVDILLLQFFSNCSFIDGILKHIVLTLHACKKNSTKARRKEAMCEALTN